MNRNKKQRFRETYDRSFQSKLVRLLCQKPSFISVIRPVVKAQYFETKKLQWFVARIYWAYDNGDRPSRAFLKRELKEHLEYGTVEPDDERKYLAFIERIPREIPDANYIETKVAEFAKHAKIKSGLYKAAVALEEDADTEKAESELNELNSLLKQNDNSIDSTEFHRYMKRYMKIGPVKLKNGIPTGWDSLDSAMGGHGGLPPGRLGTIASGTTVGKTTILTQFGANALRHFTNFEEFKTVLHLTAEDDQQAVYFRYQAHLMNLPFKKIKSRNHLREVRKHYLRLNKMLGRGWEKHLVVREFDSQQLDWDGIEGMIHQLDNEGTPVGIVICDYADHLRPTLQHRNARSDELLGNVFIQGRDMLKRTKLPGWTASQTVRDAQGAKRVRLKKIGGAIKKAECSDVLVTIEQTEKEYARGVARASAEKIRFGKAGFRFELSMDYERQRVTDMGHIEPEE